MINFKIKYALVSIWVFAFMACINGEVLASEVSQVISEVPSEEQFKKLIKENEFLKKLGDNGPLTDGEKWQIQLAIKDQNTVYTPKVNRRIDEFKGSELVIGGGKKYGENEDNRGITNIEEELKRLDTFKDVSNKFNPYADLSSMDKLTEERRKKLISETQIKINAVLDKYYTVNYDETTEPDLVNSATDIKGMTANLPDNRFDRLYYEGVNTFVFLNPNAWKIMERLCKKGGEIEIRAGVRGMRLLPIILKGTKWEKGVLRQLKEKYDYFKSHGGFILNLKN